MQYQLRIKNYLHQNTNRVDIISEAWVNGDRLADLDTNTGGIDLYLLAATIQLSGEFFLFTCSCGAPGCAGIRQRVRVHHDLTRIHWLLRASTGETQHFEFEKLQYHTAIIQGIQELRSLRQQFPQAMVFPLCNEAVLTR